MIEARGLTKRYGAFTAVNGVDLSISGNGVVGLLGPNGAGKTTTMRMLTGYLPMNEGTAKVAGFDVFDQPLEVKARVGYLPETPPLYPELSVGEYLRFVAEIRGIKSSERLRRIGEVMEQVGLRGMEAKLTGSLSKGYRQRVGLAQALVHNPSILILDEPTSGLDPAQLVGIRDLIKHLAQDRVVVLSTHVLPEVETLCGRVVLIHQGRIVGDGSTAELAATVGAGPWIQLSVVGSDEDATARLAAMDVVSKVSELPAEGALRSFRVETTEPARLAAGVIGLGWALHGLEHRAPSLQEVFLSLVEGEA
jgi:ABC-2 type transport system ATP-binding protein